MGNVCLRRNYHPHLLNKTANARELPPSLKDTAGRPGSRKTIYIRILKWNVIKIRSFDSPAFKFFFSPSVWFWGCIKTVGQVKFFGVILVIFLKSWPPVWFLQGYYSRLEGRACLLGDGISKISMLL